MEPRFLSEPLRRAGGPILRLQSDERLVRLVRAGSHPAFAELVHRYRPALVRYTGRLVGVERAEDVVQQGLTSAHTTLMNDERPIDVKPWLYRIVHNAALNLLRSDRDLVALDDHASELTVEGVEVQAAERARFRDTLRAVQALPSAQRDALLLRELEGRSHQEIATALGVTAGAARQHLMRARATMRSLATAITPYPLILHLAATSTSTGAIAVPAAEVAAGAGLAVGLSKLGAGVLAAGALAGGAQLALPAGDPAPNADRTQRFSDARQSAAGRVLADAGAPLTAAAITATPMVDAGPRTGGGARGASGRRVPQLLASEQAYDDDRPGADRRRGSRPSEADDDDRDGREHDDDVSGRDDDPQIASHREDVSGRGPLAAARDDGPSGQDPDDDVSVTSEAADAGWTSSPYVESRSTSGSSSGSSSELADGPRTRDGSTATAPAESTGPTTAVSDGPGDDNALRAETTQAAG